MDELLHNYNPGHNILELYNILVEIRFTTSKTKLDIQYSKLDKELPYELSNDLRLRKLGSIQKISNLGGHIAQCLASLQELRTFQQQLKNTQKQIPNFSSPLQFYWIIPFCSKYFVRECSLVIYVLFAKYINRRFYSCLDYVQKHSWNVYVYTTHPTVVVFIARYIAFNGIFNIFLLTGLIKLLVYLKICQRILKLLTHITKFYYLINSQILLLICLKVSRSLSLNNSKCCIRSLDVLERSLKFGY